MLIRLARGPIRRSCHSQMRYSVASRRVTRDRGPFKCRIHGRTRSTGLDNVTRSCASARSQRLQLRYDSRRNLLFHSLNLSWRLAWHWDLHRRRSRRRQLSWLNWRWRRRRWWSRRAIWHAWKRVCHSQLAQTSFHLG